MTQISDYLDRTIDLVAFSGQELVGDKLLTMELAAPNESGLVCTGVQKLAQRFLLKLLKELGSDLFRPTDGTEFMTRLNRGELRNQVDVLVAFSEAQLDCRTALRREETAADPNDERYASAVVQALTVLPGNVSLQILITSLAGTAHSVILPIAITVR